MASKYLPEELKNFNYQYLVNYKDGKYLVQIAELGILRVDTNLEQAFDAVSKEKEALFNNAIEHKSFDSITPPQELKVKDSIKESLIEYLSKATINIALVLAVSFLLILPSVDKLISARLFDVEKTMKNIVNYADEVLKNKSK